MTVIDTPAGIAFFRLLQIRGALDIQIKTGLKHSQGSVWKLAKETYGLSGNMLNVHRQLCDLVEQVQHFKSQGFAVENIRELATALGFNDDPDVGVMLIALTQEAQEKAEKGLI